MEGLANEIITVVAEALSQLDNVLCAVFVSAIKEIVDIGLMFVPGGAAVKGVGKVIQYAKSAYENGSKYSLPLRKKMFDTGAYYVLISGCLSILH